MLLDRYWNIADANTQFAACSGFSVDMYFSGVERTWLLYVNRYVSSGAGDQSTWDELNSRTGDAIGREVGSVYDNRTAYNVFKLEMHLSVHLTKGRRRIQL
jgi:hypothetical protein